MLRICRSGGTSKALSSYPDEFNSANYIYSTKGHYDDGKKLDPFKRFKSDSNLLFTGMEKYNDFMDDIEPVIQQCTEKAEKLRSNQKSDANSRLKTVSSMSNSPDTVLESTKALQVN